MRGSQGLAAALALVVGFGLFAPRPARADDRRGFKPPGRFRSLNGGFRPGFPRDDRPFPGDFRRHRASRHCWCGFDFFANPGVFHHHDRFDRFSRSTRRGPS